MEKIYANRGWSFFSTYDDGLLEKAGEDGTEVSIPHSVCDLPFNYIDPKEYQMRCVYQKVFTAPTDWLGKKIYLTFKGVAHKSEVFVNGKHLMTHRCGYTAFSVDITDAVNIVSESEEGDTNLISVIVDTREDLDQPPFGGQLEYLTYGGIYRDVYFEFADPVHMKDVFCSPGFSEHPNTRGLSLDRLMDMTFSGNIRTKVELSSEAKKCAAQQRLFICQFLDEVQISNQPVFEDGISFTLAGKVHLWDVSSPRMYKLRTELRLDGITVDTHTASIGFRDIRIDNRGFLINGRRLKIRGINRYQSFPYTGYAMPRAIQAEDARIIHEELGLNAVRTSCCLHSEDFLSACDREGLLVFTEVPGWKHIGGKDWKKEALKNVWEMVCQYRNHPSVFLWGVRICGSADNDSFYEQTNKIAHELDESRLTGGVRHHKNSKLLEDVYMYSDYSHNGDNEGCEDKSRVTSDARKPYIISGYCGHMYPSKVYDDEMHRRQHAIRHAEVLDSIFSKPDIIGGFGSSMTDYNVHPGFGSGDMVCYHGVMDMFRNPKLAASVYASQTQRTEVLAISSSFDIGDIPAGHFGKKYIITNADSVRMYRGDYLIKEYEKTRSIYGNLRGSIFLIDDYIGGAIEQMESIDSKKGSFLKQVLNDLAIYGKNEAYGYKKTVTRAQRRYGISEEALWELYNKYICGVGLKSSSFRFEAVRGGKVVRSVSCRPLEYKKLEITASADELTEEDTYDMIALRIAVTDQDGNVLSYFQEPLSVSLDGPAEIVGGKTISFRGGRCGTYIKSIGESGEAVLRFTVTGVKPRVIRIKVNVKSVKEL